MTNAFTKEGAGFAHILDRMVIGEITWDSVVGMPSDPHAAFAIEANSVSYDTDQLAKISLKLPKPLSPVWWSVPGERAVHFIISNVDENPVISGNPGAQAEQQPYTEVIVSLNKGVDWERGDKFAPHIVSKRIVNPAYRHLIKKPGPLYTSFVVELGSW